MFPLAKAASRVSELVAILGVRGAILYLQSKFIRTGHTKLHSKLLAHSLVCRPNSSDRDVFRQIFIEQEYGPLNALVNVGLIIDCGAYVGYSTTYFLNKFPESKVIAIEPDKSNFAALEKNTAPYGDRVTLINAAVWSHPTSLSFSDTTYRDGRQWAIQVCDTSSSDPNSIDAVDIDMVLKGSGYERISLLKMDVEGSEGVIFAGSHSSWIDRVDVIAIELHDDTFFGPCTEIFHSAIAERNFEIVTSGELTICLCSSKARLASTTV